NDLLGLGATLASRLRGFRDRGSLVESAQVVSVPPHVGEGACCGIGIRKGWNPRRIQSSFARSNAISSHPARNHGLAIFFGVGLQTLCNLRRVGHPLRREDDQKSIAVRIPGSNFKGASITLGISIA